MIVEVRPHFRRNGIVNYIVRVPLENKEFRMELPENESFDEVNRRAVAGSGLEAASVVWKGWHR